MIHDQKKKALQILGLFYWLTVIRVNVIVIDEGKNYEQ